jgi:SAM-dependent methyltransferase
VKGAREPRLPHYRFSRSRRAVWRAIVDHVARDVGPVTTVLELGAGYGDFINQYPAAQRVAFDIDPAMRAHAAPEVDFRVGDATLLPDVAESSVDLVFASNFLEHLERPCVERVLDRIGAVLRPTGRLALIQPNFQRCASRYFDDETHRTVFTDESLVSLLLDHGFFPLRIEPGFLPFSMNSRLPKWTFLVRAYLALPVRPLAAQMYVLAAGPGRLRA